MSQVQTWLGAVASSSGLTVAGWVAWRRRSRLSPGLAQQPVHRGHRAQVGAFVQQRGPDLGRRQVGEPLAVQHVQDRLAFGRGQRPGLAPVPVRHRRPARRRQGWPGAAGSSWPAAHLPRRTPPASRSGPPARRSPRRPRRSTSDRCPALGELLQERLQFCLDVHHEAGLGQLLLQPCLLRAQRCDLRVPGIGRRPPRGRASPASPPASRARRHSTMWLEYRPSRRKIAPFSPGCAAS